MNYLKGVAVLMLIGACDGGDPDSAQSGGTTTTHLAESTAGGSATDTPDSDFASESTSASTGCLETDFAPSDRFAGPGWDADKGLLGEPQATYYAHSTWIKIKDEPGSNEAFIAAFGPAVQAAYASEGLIGLQFGGSAHCGTGRTIGLWRSRADMLHYVASTEHIAAIMAMSSFSEDTATTSWEIAASELPLTFEAAIAQLNER